MKKQWRYLGSSAVLLFSVVFLYLNKHNIENYINDVAINEGFVVKNVSVVGVEFFSKDDVIKSLEINKSVPIFDIDIGDMVAKLILAHSWIKEAKIQRLYPDSLVVKINERKPICYFQKDYQIYLIDSDGVLMKGPNKLKNAIIVVGNMANKNANELISLLERHGVSGVISASYIGNRRWDIEFEKGITVKLPEDGLDNAIAYLKNLINEKNILQKDISFIDLRMTDKIIIKENKIKLNYKEV